MKLLFICTGNTCRSAMAQALAEKMIEDNGLDIKVGSAGLFADGHSPASENARRAVVRYGASLEGHVSTPLTEKAAKEADRIYAMTQDHAKLLKLSRPDLSDRIELFDPDGKDIPDPYGGDIEVYRKTRDTLKSGIEKMLPLFCKLL